MHGLAVYRIIVSGKVALPWGQRLCGMNITEQESRSGEIRSYLVGRLSDQSALSSILNTLYELHLPVISVDCLETS